MKPNFLNLFMKKLIRDRVVPTSQHQQHPGQPFFTGIEKLVNQILFVSNVPCQQICDKQIGHRVFFVKHSHHRLLFNSHQRTIGQFGCGTHAETLPCKASFSEEIALLQNAYCGLLPSLRQNGEFYLSFLCSLIAFQAWSTFGHAAVMVVMAVHVTSAREGLLMVSALLGVIGVALIAVAPAKQTTERTSLVGVWQRFGTKWAIWL